MAWTYLIIAGLLECLMTIALKYTDGFTKPLPSIVTAVLIALSFYVLGLALRTIPLGIGYAVWTAMGTAGAAILGIILFGETKDLAKILCLVIIIAGVVGLKFTSTN